MLNKTLLILLSLLLVNCQNKPDENKESTIKDKEGNVSEYAVNFAPLTTIYKNRMGNEVEAFYEKKFNSKDYSGSFLVAKNGEILYENYSGFAYKEKPLAKNVWAFEAMINVPIFFWSKNKAEIREAKLEKMASEKEEAALRLHTYHEIEEAYNAVKAASEIIASYEKDILPKAQTNRAIAQKAYEARAGDFAMLLEAERMYFELEIPYYETRGKLGKSQARLERIIGKRLEDL